MARTAKLTVTQCAQARALHAQDPRHWNATRLARKLKVSESSMYTVFNGSYAARPDGSQNVRTGPQRSIFYTDNPLPDIDLNALATDDELTLAAAQLIVARQNFQRQLVQRQRRH